ncbi:DUF4178 domain-containing protein [Vallitalea pronyensis]|uniref:DUF4178 domain-containing protein n=1 Tax=Vallitalea pronyensis TaxID=1348613 RepID=A0A8J8SFU2_9FIRM|nr:DUF4178 domain-containing protein [Vallitalea pronyensis]QUI21689.1 DUF4178 domain-containing protein [Vallitalea pronyensis]
MGFIDRIKKISRANKTAKNEAKDNTITVLNMRVGDIVSIEDVDYEVDGLIKFNDEGFRWTEYKLKDARKTYWLSVEQDDDIEISLFEEVVAITTEAPRVYEYKGITYYMQEGSDAIVEQVQGNTKAAKGEEVDYYEYTDEDGEHLLSIEIWNGEVEMSIGREIEDYNIEIYPRD